MDMCLLLSFSKPNKILKSIKLLKQIINFCCKEILKKKKLKHFLEKVKLRELQVIVHIEWSGRLPKLILKTYTISFNALNYISVF